MGASTAAPDDIARRTVSWVTVLIVLEVLFQRFALPGQPVALLLAIAVVWTVLAVRAGVMEIDGRRLALWLIAVACSGVALVLQTALLSNVLISTDSWLLFMAVWLPAVTRFVDRRLTTYILSMRRVVTVLTGLAVVAIAMLASQLVGIGYRDHLARYVPATLLLRGFNTTYPVEYGGSLYRSNAWVGLEPSVVSFLLGVGLLLGVLVSAAWWKNLLLACGLMSTFAGSGFMVVLVGVLVMLVFPIRRRLRVYAAPAAVLTLLAFVVPLLRPFIDRAGSEFFDSNSSASLRAVQGYIALAPRWFGDEEAAVLGRGAGAAQRYVNDLSIADLLVPTPARILFDYGFLAGAVVILVLLFLYLDGPCASVAFTCFFSLWVFQPGGSQAVFAIPVMIMVTFFAPRLGPRIEDDPFLTAPPPRTAAPSWGRTSAAAGARRG